MLINYSTTKTAGNGTNVGPGYPPNASWTDTDGVTGVGDPAFVGMFEGGQDSDTLVVDQFGFDLPDQAVVDGVSVSINGSTFSVFGGISLSAGVDTADLGALPQVYGGQNDLWGADEISVADVNDSSFGISVSGSDVSGGDASIEISLVEITVHWHIEMENIPADVPTRVDYKVFSRDGNFLGLLPGVSSDLAFSQDKDTTGASMDIVCGADISNAVLVEPLQTEDALDILTEDNLPIMAVINNIKVATGSDETEALFKNSNIVEAWLYDKWHPNGINMFTGQVNRVSFKYGADGAGVVLRVFSLGFDLANYIARGYPFSYTNDVSQTSQNGYVTVTEAGSKGAGWQRYGQTWLVGGGVNNTGAVVLKLMGTATVTLSIYDAPNGNLIGSITKSVANGSAADVQFEFGQLLETLAGTTPFMAVSVGAGQSIRVYRHSTSSTYANGTMYSSSYSGGSGGGSYAATTGDFYFITKWGTPTTTTTYTSDDPVTEMFSSILTDYNNRGGAVIERDFEATGLSLTYTFNQATIFDALKKAIELSPAGYYSYLDLGTAELDIKQQSTGADFTVVRGKDIHELEISLTIEQVKNYLLFTGGPTAGVNLFRDYQDSESAAFYGLRTVPQSDNRVTNATTADAIGNSFIEENSDEVQETKITILNDSMDITLLTPGKTLGFRNFDNFIDDLVVQIVRRDYTPRATTLTLGRLPVRMTDEIQRINRGLLNEQTLSNPSSPS